MPVKVDRTALSQRCSRSEGSLVRAAVLGDTATSLAGAVQWEKVLRQGVDAECELVFSWWKFDWLRHPGLLCEATEAAYSAEVIVVISNCDGELPPAVRDCLPAALLPDRDQSGRLLALHSAVKGAAANPALAYLRCIGSACGIQVYSSTDPPATATI